jgi:hypothetical protein
MSPSGMNSNAPHRAGRPKWLVVALLLVAAVILGATVFREPVALAAQALDARVVGPLDSGGNVRVHEGGTAAVEVTNASIAVRPEGERITVKLSSFAGGGGSSTYVVPANKRLLIQYVNGLIDASLGEFLRLHVTGTPPTHDYAFAGFAAGGVLVISEPVAITADGGQHVQLGVIDSKLELSGYLLDG